MDSVPFQYLFGHCDLIVCCLCLKIEVCVYFYVYNQVYKLFEPNDLVLVLSSGDM